MNILLQFDPDNFQIEDGNMPPSPCIGICQMDANREFCQGCYRSIPEITCWSKADPALKLQIWRDVQARMWQQMDSKPQSLVD